MEAHDPRQFMFLTTTEGRMKRLAQIVAATTAAVVGSLLYGADASARVSGDSWYCQNHTGSGGDGEHNDGLGGILVTTPDGQHVDWGQEPCGQAHQVTNS